MHSVDDVINEDVRAVLIGNGFSANEFNITIEHGSSYDPNQIVGAYVREII